MQPPTTAGPSTNLFGPANLKAAGVGALSAFVGSLLCNLLQPLFFGNIDESTISFNKLLLEQAFLFGIPGVALSAAVLAYDNQAGLRGRWDRDLWRGLLLFAPLSFFSGGLGQWLYSTIGLTRGIPWLLIGGAIGAGIGLLRGDKIQLQRGAMGGAIGGMIGGLLVDGFIAAFHTDTAFAIGSELGIIITGGAIALMMRVVQDALKDAWLLGISTGPYEGKEYPLNTTRVTVGRSELNDVALFRETTMPEQLGAFVFQDGAWWWQGSPVTVNGTFTPQTQLHPGDMIQLGATQFRYQARSVKAPESSPAPVAMRQQGYAPNVPPYVPPSSLPGTVMQKSFPATPAPTVAAKNWVLQNVTPGGSPIRLPSAPAQVQLGRTTDNQIVLGDSGVSSQHARFDVDVNTLSVTDLGSTNGTFVNGQRVAPQVQTKLELNNRLKLGRLEYIVSST